MFAKEMILNVLKSGRKFCTAEIFSGCQKINPDCKIGAVKNALAVLRKEEMVGSERIKGKNRFGKKKYFLIEAADKFELDELKEIIEPLNSENYEEMVDEFSKKKYKQRGEIVQIGEFL